MDLGLPRRKSPKENNAANTVMTHEHRSKKTIVVVAVVIVATALLLIPFPTQLSPEFTVRFVDEAGNPIVGMKVKRDCTHYTFSAIKSECPEDWDNPPVTDKDGNVRFSAKYVWYGLASRILRTILSYASLIAHGSVGRRVNILPIRQDGFAETYSIRIDLDDPQEEIVMKRLVRE